VRSIFSEIFDDDLLFAGAVLSLIAALATFHVEMLTAGQSMLRQIARGQRRRR